MNKTLLCIITASTFIGSLTASHAATTTFAQFNKASNTPTTAFVYTGNDPSTGGISTFSTTSTPVTFIYNDFLGGLKTGNNVSLFANIAAIMTLSGTSTQGALPLGSTTTPFDTMTIRFVADSTNATNIAEGIAGKTLLLETAGSAGLGNGGTLSTSPSSTSYSAGNDPNTGFSGATSFNSIDFTSDVINTNHLIGQNFALSFSAASVSYSTQANNAPNQYLNSFSADATGTFAATTVTPEPGVLAVAGAMFVGGAFGLRRRKRAVR